MSGIKQVAIMDRSPAAVRLIEILRRDNPEIQIHLILPEGQWPYDETLIADFLSGKLSADEVAAAPEKFYRDSGVNVIRGKIQSVSLTRKRILTEDKQTAEFDVLIIGDSEPRKPAYIKGYQKTGIINLHSFTDASILAKQLPLVQSVVVQAQNPLGIKAALALQQRHKEVILIVEDSDPLSHWLDEESGAVLKNLLTETGIRVLCQTQVAEVLGDLELKAVRLNSGKVFATEALILDRFEPDLRLFKDSGICNETHFVVNADGRTSVPHIFALGRAANVRDVWPWNSDVTAACFNAQAERVAAVISGRSVSIEPPLKTVSLNLPGHPFLIAGEAAGEIRGAVHTPGSANLLKKYFVKDGRVAGAVAIGFLEERGAILELVKTGADAGLIPESSVETTRL